MYSAKEWVCGNKEKVLEKSAFDGKVMDDIPIEQPKFDVKTCVNYDK